MRVQIRHDRTEYVERQKILNMDIEKNYYPSLRIFWF